MAQYPGVPWNQRPDYIALTQRVDPAGVVTAYNPPRPGVSATDVTSFVFGQATITINNWPEVMYYLHPTPEWTAFRGTPKPAQKRDAQGRRMYERFPRVGQAPRPLLDFPILPDTISSEEELWWIALWRRMDPRIQWQDILMRIEIPNRTKLSDTHLQNSSNNLINRQMHPRHSMLAWHSTGTNSMRRNEARSLVLGRVNAANPPLPPNSTRGLTPGLINPRLGNVPGNFIPFPPLGHNRGTLRVHAQPQVAQAGAAAAAPGLTNAAQSNAAQANPIQNNPGRDNSGNVRRMQRKRNRTSPDPKGRPLKRQAPDFNNDDMEKNMDTGPDGSDSSQDIPLSVAKARADAAKSRRSGKPAPAIGDMAKAKPREGAIKKKPKSRKSATAMKSRTSTGRRQPDITTGSSPESDEDKSEGGESPAGGVFLEGDPGFEEAFQASRRGRTLQQAQGTAPRPRVRFPQEDRHAPRTSPARNSSRDDVSDSELLGESESPTPVAPTQLADTVTAPRVSAPPTHPARRSPPVPRQRISAITGLPFAGRHRRPEALGGYRDSQIRRSRSPERSSRAAASTGVRITEDAHGRGVVTRESNAVRFGLPTAPANRPPPSFYVRAPDGSHRHYTDNSGIPTHVSRPEPSSNSRIAFTPNQRREGHAQINAQSAHPGQGAQPVSRSSPTGSIIHATDTDATRQTTQTLIHAPSGQRNLRASDRITARMTEVAVDHQNAVIEEMRRRESWPLEELGRFSRAMMDVMRDEENDYATGFLEREMERERRERQPSSEEDE